MTDDPKTPKPDAPSDADEARASTVADSAAAEPSKPALPKMPSLPRPVLPLPGGASGSRKPSPRPLSLPLPRPSSLSGEHAAAAPPSRREPLRAPLPPPTLGAPKSSPLAAITPPVPDAKAVPEDKGELKPISDAQPAASESLASLLSETLSEPPPAPPAELDVSFLLSHFERKSSEDAPPESEAPVTPLPPTVRGGPLPDIASTPHAPPQQASTSAAETSTEDDQELPDLILAALDNERGVEEPTPLEAEMDADALGVEIETESPPPLPDVANTDALDEDALGVLADSVPPAELVDDIAPDSLAPIDADALGVLVDSVPPSAPGAEVASESFDAVDFELDVLDLAPGDAGHDADEIDGERIGVTLATVPAPAPGTGRLTAPPTRAESNTSALGPEIAAEEIEPSLLEANLSDVELGSASFGAEISSEQIDAAELGADLEDEDMQPSTRDADIAAEEIDRSTLDLDGDDDRPTVVPEVGFEVAEPRRPPSLMPPSLDEERPAAAVLGELGLTRSWTLRAERIEAAANASNDVSAKGRGLLVASELWAMLGELERSRAAARKASQATPGVALIQRQTRMLAALDADWKVAGAQLDAEARSAPTPEARAHAAYMSAEIRRLAMHDGENAKKRLDLEKRVWPADPRPILLKLATDLGTGSHTIPSSAELGDDLALLGPAARVVARMRGAPKSKDDPPVPALAFVEAERQLAAGNIPAALDALESLQSVEGLDEAVSWLVAALSAPLAAERPRAARALRRLLGSAPDPSVRRALAARALELGDAEALAEALDGENETFTMTDRLALGALTGAGAETLLGAIAELAATPDGRPLATAAARATSFDSSLSTGADTFRTADVLGRSLVSQETISGASGPLDDFVAVHAGSTFTGLLGLEKERTAGAFSAVAERLAGWDDERDNAALAFVAGLLTEREGGSAEAAAHYLAALESPLFGEAAARALSRVNPDGTTDFLKKAAEALAPDADARGLLLYEIALRLASEDPATALELTRAAAEAAPTVTPIHRLGDQLARVLGSADELVRWLSLRQAISDDPVERALHAVREALLVVDTAPERAAQLLSQTVRARPEDIALRELAERISESTSTERGAWREAAAEKIAGSEQSAALLVEAALEYERAGAFEQAARAASEAVERGGGAFARLTAERLAALGPRASILAEQLLQQARDTEDVTETTALYEQLYRLDVARGSSQSALMWHRAILERAPEHLRSLRALEHAFIGEGRDDELEPVQTALTSLTDQREGAAHAALAARIRSRTRSVVERVDLVNAVLERTSGVLWAMRDRAALAEATGDAAALRQAYEALIARGGRSLDIAAFCLRAAEAAVNLGDLPAALELLDRALEAAPDYAIARSARAELRERSGNAAGAAEDFQLVGEASRSVTARLTAFARAGTLWLEHTNDVGLAAAVLERAAALAPDDDDIFDRLQLAYVKSGNRTELAKLLQRRLERTNDPEQRIALEVTRGRALADVGDRQAAREAFGAALTADPDHIDALEAYANLCTTEGDYTNAEKAWIRLARVCSDPARQTQVYRRLAELYTRYVKNPQRAERCYREVLKRHPEDEAAATSLVTIYLELNDTENAARLQTELVERADNAEAKRDRLVRLSEVYERAGDKKSAATVLEKARKAWPHDDVVLRTLVSLHHKHGEAAAAKILLDRAANDARRALATGRFDASFFANLVTIAELRGADDAARVVDATLAAIEGREEATVPGAGAAAGDPRLDDVIAPEVLTAPLRGLVKKLAGVLDAAFPVDLRALRAAPPPADASQFAQQIRQVAARMGIQAIDVLISPTLGATWLAASSTPPRLVVGQALLSAGDDAAQNFALFRSLKVLQSQGAAFTRLSPAEVWPAVAALLAIFAKGWQPQGIDGARFEEAKRRIEAARLPRVDDDVPTLAVEIAGAIGVRASQVGTAFQELGNRAALLATGNPSAALRALSLAAGSEHPLPPSGPERLKWIVRHTEARDLAVFSVSDAYAEARTLLGLSK